MRTRIGKRLLAFTAIIALLVVLLVTFAVFQAPIGETIGLTSVVTAGEAALGPEIPQIPIAGAFAGFTEYVTGTIASAAGPGTSLAKLTLILTTGAILMAAYTMRSRRKPIIDSHEADADPGFFRRYTGNTSEPKRYPDCGTVSQGALAGGD